MERSGQSQHLIALLEEMLLDLHFRPLEEWSDLELTMPQVRALMLLYGEHQRVGELAAKLGASLPSVTGMIDRLAAKGLVRRVRDPGDRRVVTCMLTKTGEGEVERFWRLKQVRIDEIADYLTTEELAKVVDAMELMTAAIRRGESEPANLESE